MIVQVYKKKPLVYNFCSISDITIEDVGSFTCELKGGNIIKQRQSIFILSTSLIIHHTKTVIVLLNKGKKAWFIEKTDKCSNLFDI